MTEPADPWPCQSCGHRHYPSQRCADHAWTDTCPYEGLGCPSPDERARRTAEATAAWATRPDILDKVAGGKELTLDDLIDPPTD